MKGRGVETCGGAVCVVDDGGTELVAEYVDDVFIPPGVDVLIVDTGALGAAPGGPKVPGGGKPRGMPVDMVCCIVENKLERLNGAPVLLDEGTLLGVDWDEVDAACCMPGGTGNLGI